MKLKNAVCAALLSASLFTPSAADAVIPGISPDKYIRTYILGEENIPVYTDSSLTTRGTANPYKVYDSAIYPIDEIRVYEIQGDWAYVSYPTNWSGWREGYIPLSAITENNFSKDGQKFRGVFKFIYKRPFGPRFPESEIFDNDTVYTMARSGEYTQIIYPAVDVYKMVWIRTGAYEECVTNNPANQLEGRSILTRERYTTRLAVPYYHQDDTRQRKKAPDEEQPKANGERSLLASMAMKYSYHTHSKIYPKDMKKMLALQDSRPNPTSLKNLGYSCLNYHSSMENSMLNKILVELAYGKPVLLCCEGAEDFHWIVVTGYDGSPTGKLSPKNFFINDPQNPACKDLGDFLARHSVVHQIIF